MATCVELPVVTFLTPRAPEPAEVSIRTPLLARVRPARKLIVLEVAGTALPGKKVRCPVPGGLMTVTLAGIAFAVAGTPQRPSTTTIRSSFGESAGPP